MSRRDVKRISTKTTVSAIALAIAFTAAPAIQGGINPLSEVYAVQIIRPDVILDVIPAEDGTESFCEEGDAYGTDVTDEVEEENEEEVVEEENEEEKEETKEKEIEEEEDSKTPVDDQEYSKKEDVVEEKKEENEQKPAAPTSSGSSSGGGSGSVAGSRSVTPVNSSSTESFGPGVSAATAEEPQTELTEEADQVGQVLGADRVEEAPTPKVLNANRSNVSTADTQSMMLHAVMAAQSAILLAAYFVVKRRIFAK